MNETINALISSLNTQKEACKKSTDGIKELLFKAYRTLPEVQAFCTMVENVEGGYYNLSCDGLEYITALPSELKALPFIEEYLREDVCGYVDGGFCHQFHGMPILINLNPRLREVMAYDTDTNKVLLERVPEEIAEAGKSEDYLSLTVELYQRAKGEFNDVVLVDCQGDYNKHFESPIKGLGAMSDDEVKALLELLEFSCQKIEAVE